MWNDTGICGNTIITTVSENHIIMSTTIVKSSKQCIEEIPALQQHKEFHIGYRFHTRVR